MSFSVAGVSHNTASLELREKLAVVAGDLRSSLAAIRRKCALDELVVLSTCNRLEFYFRGDGDQVIAHMAAAGGFPVHEAHNVIYRHDGEAAARHLFSVAAGLDAMIFGETEVLAQCKAAYEAALTAGATGAVLNAAFQQAFLTAKRVHCETAISRGHTSVGSVAAALVRRIFGGLDGRGVLVIGAGTMASNTLENLARLGPREVVIANRSIPRARELAGRFGGRAARLSSVESLLEETDVVVASASSASHIVTRDLLESVSLRRKSPFLILDIAVPRNVEPAVAELSGVSLYNIDSLKETADKNAKARKRASAMAHRIVSEEAGSFESLMAERRVAPLVAELKEMARKIASSEVRAALRRVESGAVAADEIEKLAHRVANKILHAPVAALKQAAANGGAERLADAARKLHGLKDDAQR